MAECVLGCPETRVYLMDFCGRRTVADLTDSVSFLDYGLTLDDDSEVEVSLHFRGDASGSACCEALADARTWRNEIMVVRGGEVVWGPGPVVTISIQREIAHLVARDICAWLNVRLVHLDYDFHDADLAAIAFTTIVDALTLGDAASLPTADRDVNILDFVQFSSAGKTTDMKIDGNKESAFEVLKKLRDEGLDFTVVKRSLILGSEFAFGPIGPLRDEDFLGDLEITEHGLAAATSWRVANSDATGQCGGASEFYGLIERAVEDASSKAVQADLDRQACDRLAASNPPPLTVNVPSGSQLSPEAHVCPSVLIPGMLIDVVSSELCREVFSRQRLTAVDYRSDENGEAVSVTIAPVGPLTLDDETGDL